MSAAWVAGTVRAQAISRRRIGSAGARALAASDSLGTAVEALTQSPYGRLVRPGDTLTAATAGVESTLLWNLRVLAGWLPAGGAGMLRVLAGWFEIANVEEHLRSLAALPAQPPFSLGALATAWPRLAATASRDELRAALAASPWGDPGATSRAVQLAMRLTWAERVATRVPAGHAWSLGAAALLVAREHIARRQPLPERAAATAVRLLGTRPMAASTLEELGSTLPMRARWALDGLTDPIHLWQGEARWWRRLRTDSAALLGGSSFGPDRILGAAGLLAADAWLVKGALATASAGSAMRRRAALEVFDAVA